MNSYLSCLFEVLVNRPPAARPRVVVRVDDQHAMFRQLRLDPVGRPLMVPARFLEGFLLSQFK